MEPLKTLKFFADFLIILLIISFFLYLFRFIGIYIFLSIMGITGVLSFFILPHLAKKLA